VHSAGAEVVWFKRDLRVRDHRPLLKASRSGHPIVCLYVDEPELLRSDEWDERHSAFIEDSLRALDDALKRVGSRLTRRSGCIPGVFDGLLDELKMIGGIRALWSHEETGNAITFARDRRVSTWCRGRRIEWRQIPQHGVFRGLRSRDGWAGRWAKRMNEPLGPPPEGVECVSRVLPGWRFGEYAERLGASRWQSGGEPEATRVLDSFLSSRGVNYRADMASPASGEDGCSRLSPHLAWGTISIRTVHHALRQRQAELRETSVAERDPRWLKSLTSFQGRLRWHCHFIQKLESEPQIEFENMNRSYDGLRNQDRSTWTEREHLKFEAWRLGRTGYPFVDACMRCLAQTGWMNFRMRSMLVSFASYHLWLHWRPTSTVLARYFTDFEPGIHYSQFQMQSGTTGINTVRIYNPIKQSMDQDPDGTFIRKWVPELADVPKESIHEPWKHLGSTPGWELGSLFEPDLDIVSAAGHPYPPPIVEHVKAYRTAQERVFAVRKTVGARAEAARVYNKHGSRRRPNEPKYRGGPEDRGT